MLHRGSGSFDFDGVGVRHRHSKRHKKSKGHRGKKRDCLSLSLEPNDDEDPSPHPLSRAAKVQSAYIPSSSLPTSSPDYSGKQDPSPVQGETAKISPNRGLTKAVVTDLDGFAWGGDGGGASVDKTLPSSAIPRETVAQPTQSSGEATDRSSSSISTEPSAVRNTPQLTTAGGVVLRRRISLPEDTLRSRSSGSLQFVRELGLVQIKEDDTRGLRPRSAVLLSDGSEPDLTTAVVRATMSRQKARLSKAMKRQSTDFGEGVRSNSSMALNTRSETSPVDSFKNGETKIGKGRLIY